MDYTEVIRAAVNLSDEERANMPCPFPLTVENHLIYSRLMIEKTCPGPGYRLVPADQIPEKES